MTASADIARLTLKIERAKVARAHIQTLLTAADASLAGHQMELRALQAIAARKLRTPLSKRGT
jgi:hypothetical protein